jgi:hypothetical protein
MATYPRTLQVYSNPSSGAISKEFATVGLKNVNIETITEATKTQVVGLVGMEQSDPRNGCPYRKSDRNVLVMQSAEMWLCEDSADSLNFARDWCVLVQRQVRAGLIVICQVR